MKSIYGKKEIKVHIIISHLIYNFYTFSQHLVKQRMSTYLPFRRDLFNVQGSFRLKSSRSYSHDSKHSEQESNCTSSN